jgi:hypothetical protein
MSNKLLLLGLPGCGQSRFVKSVGDYCHANQHELPEFLTTREVCDGDAIRTWTLIDIRSELSHSKAEVYLLNCLQQSSAVIFTFAESADLSVQAFWQNWMKKHDVQLPIMRWFSQTFPENWHWQELGDQRQTEMAKLPLLELEQITFDVEKVYLEHLLFGLDAVKQNLGMDIWRVKANLQTQEYENPVAIEGTVNRWDTFAANKVEEKLEILGTALDETMLQEIVTASKLV